MLQTLQFDQFGIPKEHDVLWYDRSHGFNTVPDWWENSDGSPDPVVPLYRVFSEEVYGTSFSSSYSFGSTGNTQYIGNLYSGSGRSVAVFASAGNPTGQIQLNVSSGSSLTIVSAFGVTSTVPVVNGIATLTVGEVPTYVELAGGQSITVVPQSLGTNLAAQSGVTALSSGDGNSPIGGLSNDIAKTHDGKLQSHYVDTSAGGDVWYDNTPAGQPAWLELDLPQPQTIGNAVIYSALPYNEHGSLLDFQVQYLSSGGQWTTIDHVQVSPNVVGACHPAPLPL